MLNQYYKKRGDKSGEKRKRRQEKGREINISDENRRQKKISSGFY